MANNTTAGYSGTPLIKKLGIIEEMKILLVNQPTGYFELLQKDVGNQVVKGNAIPDFVHLFADSTKQFELEMQKLESVYKLSPLLIIWVSWYKKTSGIPTDLTEDIIRQYALSHGLVDVKVCAVSGIWSGLKLVVPKALR
ncbi:MAG: hypothetical protein ACXWCG_09935 [Flavitalea sp.]